MSENMNKLQFNLSAVNSHDYWLFRKANNNLTHQAFCQIQVVKQLEKERKTNPTHQDVWDTIRKMYDNEKTANLPQGETNRQVLQYLNQLSDKGFNRLINAIRLTVITKNQ